MRIKDAAAELGVSPNTLRRWIKGGAPVARHGRRGFGGAVEVDVGAIRAWRNATGGTDALRAFAGRIPELLAQAAEETFLLADGSKRDAASNLAAGWLIGMETLLAALRVEIPDLGEIEATPEGIERLRGIAKK